MGQVSTRHTDVIANNKKRAMSDARNVKSMPKSRQSFNCQSSRDPTHKNLQFIG